ncbi:MAG: hypothetical protein KC502_17815 [Myxococcales bacterium]|nr:hypothetical protein [Myxococcales bacterium]
MDKARLNWSEFAIPLSEVSGSSHPMLKAKKGFYALVSADLDAEADLWRNISLLHIGHTSGQTLRARIDQAAPGHERSVELAGADRSVLVMLGELESSSLGRDTRDFMRDVELCLIRSNMPAAHPDPESAIPEREISVVNGERRGTSYRPLKWRSLFKFAHIKNA